jgi:hypothetical protein
VLRRRLLQCLRRRGSALSLKKRPADFVDVLAFMTLVGFCVARWIPIARLIPGWGCALRQMTGWPCPACGLTRAAEHFAHGRLSDAFAMHPLGASVGTLLVVLTLYAAARWFTGFELRPLALNDSHRRRLRWAVATAFVFNYAYLIATMKFGLEPLAWR